MSYIQRVFFLNKPISLIVIAIKCYKLCYILIYQIPILNKRKRMLYEKAIFLCLDKNTIGLLTNVLGQNDKEKYY